LEVGDLLSVLNLTTATLSYSLFQLSYFSQGFGFDFSLLTFK